jgi:small-conductance mechanosensitive channel
MIDWLIANWLNIVIPLLAFLATCIVGLWLRRFLESALRKLTFKTRVNISQLLIVAVHRMFLLWFLLLGVAIAIQVSVLPVEAKSLTARVTGSLFVVSLGWVLITFGTRLVRAYLPGKDNRPTTAVLTHIINITVIVIGVLIVLEIWGMPTTPLLFLAAVAVLAIVVILRDTAANFFAGLNMGASQQVRAGDYIKLESGEEGYVTEVNWSNTRLKALDDSLIVIPNNHLIQSKFVNYGHPLKKATEPFSFYSHAHLPELTGLRARSLRELVDVLKKVPDSVIFYHTHHFLEEHHYLTPEPANDFGVWVNDALGEEALGEKLMSVNTFEFNTSEAMRERFVGIIEEYLARGADSREAMPGREFYFMKLVSINLPTPYTAHDLREFVEILRKISLGSIFFHVFESRLRLEKGLNDFSIWIRDSLDEADLAEEIARLDPYTYTLEGLRLALIRLIEKRIK